MFTSSRILLLWSAGILFASGCNQSSEEPTEATTYTRHEQLVEVEVVPIVRKAIRSEQEFTGDLLPRRMTRIVAEVDGMVQSIPQVGAKFDVTLQGQRYTEQLDITYGQSVKQGDLLLQLDPRGYEIELRMAEAKLAKAKADLAKLQAWDRVEEVRRLTALRTEVEARMAQSERNLERMKSLLPTNAISQSEYEYAVLEVSTAKAMLDSADATLAAAKAGPTREEVDVQQALVAQAEGEVEQKQLALDKTTITAPYDGVVTAVNMEVGERVSPSGETLIELMDLRYLVAELGIPESYVGAVHVGDQAAVISAGSAVPVPGLVVAINSMVDPTTRTFRIRVAVDNAAAAFKAGQFAKVRLSLQGAGPERGTAGESLVAPNRSLVFIEGQPHVFVVEGTQVHQRAVTQGLSADGFVEILSGVALGDRVVVDDPSLLADGMSVVIKPDASQVALR